MHVGVGQLCCAPDEESPAIALQAKENKARNVPLGRWMKVKGSKMQAHSSSGVVMDIAAFKVNHSEHVDKDATALQAKKVERITFHRGDGMLRMGSIRGKAYPLPQTHMATVSTPAGRWNVTHGFDSRETGGNVAEGSKGEHSAPQMHILL